MSTVGIELANFNLNWKVSKGNRSTTRRLRKPVDKILRVGTEAADKIPKSLQEVSESEKFGVAVLGRRFGDKIEQVPIKKRRLLRSSPSTRSFTPHNVGYEQRVDSKRGQLSSSKSTAKRQNKFCRGVNGGTFCSNISEMSNGKLGHTEDFSGIEILADVACNSSIVDDESYAEGLAVKEKLAERVASSTCGTSFKETIGKGYMEHKDKIEGSFFQGISVAVLHDLSSNKDNGKVNSSVSLQVGRPLWDLNAAADAWEKPDTRSNQEGISGDDKHSEKLECLVGCEIIQTDPGDSKHDIGSPVQFREGGVVSVDVHGDIHMLSDFRSLDSGTHKSNEQENNIKECSGTDRTCFEGNCVSTPIEYAPELSTSLDGENVSTQIVGMDPDHNNPPDPVLSHITSTWTIDENISTEHAAVNQNGEYCASDMQLVNTVSLEGGQAKKQDGASLHAPTLENTVSEIDGVPDIVSDVFSRTTGLHDNSDGKVCPRNLMSKDICQPLGCDALHGENSVRNSYKAGVSYYSPVCEGLSATGRSAWGSDHVLNVDEKGQVGKASVADTAEVDHPVQGGFEACMNAASGVYSVALGAQGGFTSHGACRSYGDGSLNPACKVDPFNGDVSEDNQGQIVGTTNETKLEEGYDSQFEDGELRESAVHFWVENGTNGVEAEPVDYKSSGVAYDVDANYSVAVPGKVEVALECEKQRFYGSNHIGIESERNMEKGFRDSSYQQHSGVSLVDSSYQQHSGVSLATNMMEEEVSRRGLVNASKMQTRKQLIRTEEVEVEVNLERGLHGVSNNANEKIEHFTRLDSLREPSYSPSSRDKVSGWDQLPEGCRISADVSGQVNDGEGVGSRASRMDMVSQIKGPSLDDILHEKDADFLQGSRSQGGDDWVDHSVDYWDSKHHPSFSYYGPYDSGHPGRKGVIVNSKGVYRRLIRKPHGDMDDAYGMDVRVAPLRDFSTDRSRGRPRRYAHGVGRGPRDGYHGRFVPDGTTESSFRVPHHLARREQSFSPIARRGAPHYSQPRKKSRSRSRTRSPPLWGLPRERNVGLRHLSRSPDFRSEARMERTRQFQKPSFAEDYETGFISPPRRRYLQQRNSRWIENRDCAVNQFRDRRSPVRMFRQSQRFDSVVSPGRLKSDDYFRPMIRPGRFHEMDGGGRGRRYERYGDDRRKHNPRYAPDMIHPVRRFERDGIPRRFRYDTEDNFVADNSHEKDDFIRGTDRRVGGDMPRRAREEKDHPRYNDNSNNNNDRMYDSSPKSFGMGEFDEDASPRSRQQPSS